MGNRSLETRNSKRSQFNPQTQAKKEPNIVPLPNNGIENQNITVGALEVQNVKRAINRYGTLPKGARIGAYLESLRQTTDTTNAPPTTSPRASPKELDSHEPLTELPPPSPAITSTSLSSNTNSLNQSAMSPRAVIKSQPQMIRSNSSGGVTMTNSASQSVNKLQRYRTTTEGTMMTFSSFRATGGSPKRSMNPSLADLEFPPPPLDLPPPPEEFESVDAMQVSQTTSLAPSTDVSNTEPSVEEASSRFGVSLRKREPSTDSCSSLGSPAAANAGEVVNGHATNERQKSNANEVNDSKEKAKKMASEASNRVAVGRPTKNVDHISQLVNELAESMNLPKTHSADLAKKKANKTSENNNATSANNFKAQLKKVDPKKQTTKDEPNNPIVDFKSRLRRVDNNSENETSDASLECKKIADIVSDAGVTDESDVRNNFRKNSIKLLKKNGTGEQGVSSKLSENDVKKTEIKIVNNDDDKGKHDGGDAKNDDDDKRKSTGSISSLKKLWETKEGSNGIALTNESNSTQISPKMTSRTSIGSGNNNNGNGKSSDEFDDQTTNANKKPAVPTKPTKLNSIYATPIQVKLTDVTNHSSGALSSSSSGNCNDAPAQINRDSILELIQVLEASLKCPINTISASQWLQLSDRLNILQNSCVNFAEKSSMAPHSKFQFRELVSRAETQSRSFRSAGSKNIRDNEKLIQEVGQTLKQISNTLHR